MLSPPESLRDRISQLIFPRIGSNMSPSISVEEDAGRIENLMRDYPIGGLCLFNGDRIRTPQTLTRLQSLARFPLLVAPDMERGLGQQLRGATLFPHAMAFQAIGDLDEELLEAAARAAAREALAAGLHISFSPVADVNSNPLNPIISTRAFGTSAETVSRLVSAYIRGCNGEGLLSTAKHFPGHWDTDVDSHEGRPVVSSDRKDLEQLEFIPFRRAIESGVSLVMTAHVAYPGLDETGVEATRSREIVTELLRKKLNFRGAVISDSLMMAGVEHRDEHPGALAADVLKAGVDILLDVKDVPATVEYLTTAVLSGDLSRSVVDTAFERVWSLKTRLAARFGKGMFVDPSLAQPLSVIGKEEHRFLARRIASESIQLAIGEKEEIALQTPRMGQKGPLFILMGPHQISHDSGTGFLEKSFLSAFPSGSFCNIGPDAEGDDHAQLIEEAGQHSDVIVGMVVKPSAWHRYGLLPFQKQLVDDLVSAHPVYLAALGSPVVLADFQDVRASICAYSDVEPSMSALVDYLVELKPAPFEPSLVNSASRGES